MTNDELQKLAAALGDCGKALLKISEVMAVKEDNPTASEAKSEKLEKPLTLEDVRRVAADKARQGHTDEVRQLIQKFGADKLSGVDAAKYPALMEELEAMGHAD
ncbi:MAG: rRNA biogenesis protein rrp5 [Succiniclasticum sp.]|nr:rRNA biogenesis protein rrp5 [Succiniclasticum sp.]